MLMPENRMNLNSVKMLFKELPYYNVNIQLAHGQFNNLLNQKLHCKNNLDKLHSLYDLDLFKTNLPTTNDIDSNLQFNNIRSNYYSPISFQKVKTQTTVNLDHRLSIFHNNVRSLNLNLEKLQTQLLDELEYSFDIIGITETKITNASLPLKNNLNIPGYNFEYVPTPLASGGVGMYVNNRLKYSVIETSSNVDFQALWIEIQFESKKNILCGLIYRQHSCPENFLNYLEETIDKYNMKNRNIYLIGDFNIDLLKCSSCKYSSNFLLELQSCLLLPTIDKPTRVYNSSATLIDNIFTNNPSNVILSGNIVSDISDHYSQFCISMDRNEYTKSTRKKRRFISTKTIEDFTKDLSKADFVNYPVNILHNRNNVDQLFSYFYKSVNYFVNKHAPMHIMSNRKVKQLKKPWITQGIRKSIRIKNQLFYDGDTSKYKHYRNMLTKLIRTSKQQYYANYFESNLHNMKNTWAGINSLINSKKYSKKSLNCLKDPYTGQKEYNESKLCNIMNTHFTSIGSNLASKIPHSEKHFSDYLKHIDQRNSFFFNPVTKYEIEDEILALKTRKAHGLYSCPIDLLKASRHLISEHLAFILNTSVTTGMYPSKLKLTKVIPVFKSEDDSDPNNYRPIALLSVFNKIFEKLMSKRLINFINENHLLNEFQYGFREKHSTQHAILDIINKIQSNIDCKLYSCAIFIDLSKAFDTVDHKILLGKLNSYGIRGIINSWFKSYLQGRTQTTSIGQSISQKNNIPLGVPQGSVLGPLLFLLYINDISVTSKILKFHLFADDTNILYANKSLKSIETVVNAELKKLHEWLIVNKLTLNIKKSNFIIFSHSRKKSSHQVNLKIDGVHLERKEYVKYLGILLDCHLTWKPHIDLISDKISKTIGLISKLRHFVPTSTLLTIYRSLIQPYLTYGLCAWGQAYESHLKKILLLQKKALRLIYFIDRKDSALPLFISARILPINYLFSECVVNLLHDVVNNTAPINIQNLFTSVANIHSYNTRASSSENLYMKHSRTNLLKNSFSRVGVKMWNQIPYETRNSSRRLFKKSVRTLLFNDLNSQGYDIEISNFFSSI